MRQFTDKEIYDAWAAAEYKMLTIALSSGVAVVWWQEEILRILNDELEGFAFYENF